MPSLSPNQISSPNCTLFLGGKAQKLAALSSSQVLLFCRRESDIQIRKELIEAYRPTTYETSSLIFTTNKEIADWAEMMGDPVLTTALLDRILQHASCFSVKGESYRLKHPHVFPAPLKKKRGSWQVQGKKKLILPREECCTW